MTNDHQIVTIRTFDQFRDLCMRRNFTTSQIADLAAKIKMVWVLDHGQYTPATLLDALAKFHETYFTDDDRSSRPLFLDVKLNVV